MQVLQEDSDEEYFNYQLAQPNGEAVEDLDDGFSSESSCDSDYETADEETKTSHNEYQRYICESSRVLPRFNDLTPTCVTVSCYMMFNYAQQKISKYCVFCAATLENALHIDNLTSCMKHYVTNVRYFNESDAQCEKCRTKLWITIPCKACLVCHPQNT